MRLLVLASLLVLGCSRRAPVADRVVEAGAVVASAAPSAAPAPVVRKVSFAAFDEGQLSQCVDLAGPAADVDGGSEFDDIEKSIAKDATSINQPCAVGFKDRVPLASCAMSRDGLSMTTFIYNFEMVGETDEQMAACLKLKGNWHALSRDSREWKKAKVEHARKDLKKHLKKLQNAQDPDEP